MTLHSGNGSDYTVTTDVVLSLPFGRCDRINCLSIPILDDRILEQTEYFQVLLLRNGFDEDIQLGITSASIEIIDDDGRYIYSSHV